jgi:septum site-determining protein MinD
MLPYDKGTNKTNLASGNRSGSAPRETPGGVPCGIPVRNFINQNEASPAMTTVCALVGVAGGVGATRLTYECAALLAATGRTVAVFDAAFDTQGLAAYVDGRLDADATALLTDEVQLEAALHEQPLDVPGRLVVCPAAGPFERLARAKTAGAANRFEDHLAATALSHDVVLVDTPPVGANQSVAAVNAADRTVLIAPDSPRGDHALALARERLADVGSSAAAVVANRSDGDCLDADVHVPTAETTRPTACPACLPVADDPFTRAVAGVADEALDVGLDIDWGDPGRVGRLLGR